MEKSSNIVKYTNMIVSLIFVMLLYTIKDKIITKNTYKLNENSTDEEVCIFVQESCIHCHDLKRYCETIDISKYNVKFYDIRDKKNLELLLKYANKHHLSFMELGTPAIFFKGEYMIGFDLEDKDGEKFVEFLDKTKDKNKQNNEKINMVSVPLLGNFDKTKLNITKLLFLNIWSYFFSLNNLYSLIFITIILLIINIKDKKIVILTYFVFLTLIRFLFLTSFINISLFVKLTKIILLILGYYIIYKSINNLNSLKNHNYEIKKIEEKLSTKTVLFITLLTFLAATTEFIEPIKILNIYTNLINQPEINKFNYLSNNFIYVFSTTVLSFLVFHIWHFLIKKIKLIKNNLTIINELLIFFLGIFIIFI